MLLSTPVTGSGGKNARLQMEITVEVQALPTTLASTVQAHVDSLPTVNSGQPEVAGLAIFPLQPT